MAGAARPLTVSGPAVQRLYQQLAALGLPQETIFRQVGLQPPHWEGHSRGPRVAFLSAKAAAAKSLDDPCLGFRLGVESNLDSFDLYGAVIAHTGTLAEAIQVGLQFRDVWEQGSSFHLQRGAGWTRLVYENSLGEITGARIDSQQTIVSVAQLVRDLLRRAAPGISLGFACSKPTHEACTRAARAFGTPRYDEPQWYVELPEKLLLEPLPPTLPAVRRLLHEHLTRQLEELRREQDLVSQVRETIRGGLSRRWSLSQVAAVVGSSARTLQSALKESGTTFSQQIAAVRLERAREMLTEDVLTIKEIADRVGFQSLPGFSRFFSEQMKLSPSQYREQSRVRPAR
jgi:AraC-like DNA-binding protein